MTLAPACSAWRACTPPTISPAWRPRRVRRSEDHRASLASGAVTGVSVVDHLDEISDAVCSVVDVAELCNVHPDPAWVDAANRAYVSLQGYVQGLNADRGLYDALVRAQSDASASGSFTPEAARVALTLRHDFERGGIHLDDDARARLERASADALRAAMRFQSNLADPRHSASRACLDRDSRVTHDHPRSIDRRRHHGDRSPRSTHARGVPSMGRGRGRAEGTSTPPRTRDPRQASTRYDVCSPRARGGG